MAEQSGRTASEESASETKPRRGPRKEADIRAEVEAQMRAEVEAQVRAEMEEKIRREMQEQAEEQRRKDELSRSASSDKPVTGFQISGNPQAEGSVTIHFVDDGFTVLGKVWYRGEELTIVPGTKQWDQSPEYKGKIFAVLDEFEQEEIWGRRFFRLGPWRGKRLTEIDDPELTEAERNALAKAEQIRNERFGAVVPTS